MHRTISLKYRVVRRVDIDKAPLATFDTVDLGDEDDKLACHQSESSKSSANFKETEPNYKFVEQAKTGVFIKDGGLKSKTIGGNNSKKSLSQAGGEEKESKDDRTKDKSCLEVENIPETNQSKNSVTEPATPETNKSENKHSEIVTSQRTDTTSGDREKSVERDATKSTIPSSLLRQGTIGRVNIPIKKQDSDSSSSPGSCNETPFTFQSQHSTAAYFDRTPADEQSQEFDGKKDTLDSLTPEYLDPSQILSPSKRKAYERRIERLRVTTSPIARPRSNAPINVVTLDEYAAITSPEPSPATPSVPQDKLKITLPCDEFTSRPKTPKLQSAKKQDSDDTCFEFTEDFLFSRTKSALVVGDDRQLSLSPRRILIPPNLTPSTSPQLSSSPILPSDNLQEPTSDAPKLIYTKESEAIYKYFGVTVDESEEENWAHFPEPTEADETADHDTSTSTVCDTTDNDLHSSSFTGEDFDWATGNSGDFPVIHSGPTDIINSQLDLQLDLEVQNLNSDLERPGIISAPSVKSVVSSEEEGNSYSNIDLRYSNQPAKCFTQAAEVPQVGVDPDFECEEIITIEINQSATGDEKHIGIEIKSRGSSASVSPVCCDPSAQPWSPDSEKLFLSSTEASDIQPTNLDLFHPVVPRDYSETISSIDNVSSSRIVSSLNEVYQSSASADYQMKTENFLHETELNLASPFDDKPQIPPTVNNNLIDSQFSLVNQQHSSQLLDQTPELKRPPSTNPFDEDYEPPSSDPFDLEQFQGRSTNPFLDQPTTVSSDLFLFSSSLDNSSA